MGESLPQEIDLSTQTSPEACLEVSPDGCPRLSIAGGLLPSNGQIVLGYPDLGDRPIPLISDKNGTWVPAVKWAPLQHWPPTSQEVAEWWMKYPRAGIALICGREAELMVLDVGRQHGEVDPKLSASACSTPGGGIHYHFVAPAPIPELDSPGLEWLGDGHMARLPPTPHLQVAKPRAAPQKGLLRGRAAPAGTAAPATFCTSRTDFARRQPSRDPEPGPGGYSSRQHHHLFVPPGQCARSGGLPLQKGPKTRHTRNKLPSRIR